jgi:hypothetical protein
MDGLNMETISLFAIKVKTYLEHNQKNIGSISPINDIYPKYRILIDENDQYNYYLVNCLMIMRNYINSEDDQRAR